MSVTNSLTSTLSIFSNLSEENGQNRNDTDNYYDLANISKQMQSFETSNGIYYYLIFVYFNIPNKKIGLSHFQQFITSVSKLLKRILC